MLGVQFGEIIHALQMAWLFIFMLFVASKIVDPMTLKVGSPEWSAYVKNNYRDRGW